jgi:hypothetical protein
MGEDVGEEGETAAKMPKDPFQENRTKIEHFLD